MVVEVSECQNLEKCNFFQVYQYEKKRILKGFISLYCKGEYQDKCLRKKVSKALGGPKFVPSNMMPNGLPLVGTNDLDWPSNLKEIIP